MPAPTVTSVWGQQTWSATLIEALTVESVVLAAGANRVIAEGRTIPRPAPLGRSRGRR